MNRTLKVVAAVALVALLVLPFALSPASAKASPKGRWLKIRVFERDATTPSVLVNLPMSFVKTALKVLVTSGAAHASIHGSLEGEGAKVQIQDMDLEEFLKELESMEPGQIIEVNEDGQRVSIWIE